MKQRKHYVKHGEAEKVVYGFNNIKTSYHHTHESPTKLELKQRKHGQTEIKIISLVLIQRELAWEPLDVG